ncbi:MAG: hypothetical protein V3S24_03020 [Candidatus Tectomicrobia bacterium]
MPIHDRDLRKAIRGIVALVAMAGMLTMFGCSGGGDGAESSRAATAGDLENQVLTFSDGAVFAAALANTEVRLTFSDFDTDGDGNPNTGPFTLASVATGEATGTGTIGSCNLAVAESTFDPETFPELQPEQTIPLDPCEVNTDDGSLSVQNATTGATAISGPPSPIPTNNVAFILTEGGGTGSYSVVDLQSRDLFADITLGGVHSDAVPARVFDGRIYVVNRLGVDSIQIIDPQQGYTTPPGAELSVGNGANPHDIAFVSADKAYVSRFGAAELFIINPTTLTQVGEIDLSSLVKLDDLDGLPEMDRMIMHNGLLYLTLEHLDTTAFFTPLTAGEVVVIDPATDTIVRVIQLNARNPFSSLQFSPALNRILVSTVGNFGVADGGIEAINPETNTVDPGFILDEATTGGEITHFEVVSATQGFAVFGAFVDGMFLNTLVSFNPSTGELGDPLLGPLDTFLPHFAINSRNELYLAVNDDETPTPGVRVFDIIQEVELDQVLSGALPPVFVVFIEE